MERRVDFDCVLCVYGKMVNGKKYCVDCGANEWPFSLAQPSQTERAL